MVAVARMTRSIEGVELGVSSRGIMHWASASKATARLNGRNYVSVADAQEIAPVRPPPPPDHARRGEGGRRARRRVRAGSRCRNRRATFEYV